MGTTEPPAPRERRSFGMWDLIGEAFLGESHLLRRILLMFVLIAVGVFAVWKSLPETARQGLVDPFVSQWRQSHLAGREAVARASADTLEGKIPPLGQPIQVVYYGKPNDAELSSVLIPRLEQRGFDVRTAPASRSERSNAVWCGSQVSAADCVLVALRMVQTGFPVTQVFRFPPGRDRPRQIQIGYNDNVGRGDTLSVTRLVALSRTGLSTDMTPR
jgi:hypothetical protein